MILSNFLWIMFHTSSPNIGIFQLIYQVSMQFLTKISNSTSLSLKNNWFIIIRNLSFRLCIYSDEIEVIPNGLIQFFKIPF